MNNGDWTNYQYGTDAGFRFEYAGTYGQIPFNVRFSRNIGVGYDFIEWTIYTEVSTIDSISAYSSVSEYPLPIEVSYLDGEATTDPETGDKYPERRLISVVIDCTTLNWDEEKPYLRIYGTWWSDPGYEGQNVTVWGCAGYNVEDVITPEVSWLEKIWNAVTSGFNSVSSTLSDILDALGGGSAGDDLVEGGDQIADAGSGLKDDIGKIEDFEQEHFGALDNNMGTIVGGGDLTALAAPLAFVQRYVNLIIAGIPSNYLVIFTLPILFGIFMYIVGHPIRAPRPDTSGDQVTRETFTTTTVLEGRHAGATTTTRTVTVSQEIGRVHNE